LDAVAVEFLPNADRVSPRFPAMFAFQMLGSTPQDDAYTAASSRKWAARQDLEK
jgi:hypothetical protein